MMILPSLQQAVAARLERVAKHGASKFTTIQGNGMTGFYLSCLFKGRLNMYIINKDFGWMTIDNDFYLCSEVSNKVYKLNETANVIWTMIINNSDSDIDQFAKKMLNEYDCASDTIKQDIADLIDYFISIGAIYKN